MLNDQIQINEVIWRDNCSALSELVGTPEQRLLRDPVGQLVELKAPAALIAVTHISAALDAVGHVFNTRVFIHWFGSVRVKREHKVARTSWHSQRRPT